MNFASSSNRSNALQKEISCVTLIDDFQLQTSDKIYEERLPDM